MQQRCAPAISATPPVCLPVCLPLLSLF
jgi:hypothetical protein